MLRPYVSIHMTLIKPWMNSFPWAYAPASLLNLLSLFSLLAFQNTKTISHGLCVICNGIEIVLVKLNTNVCFNDSFEEQRINIKQTQENEVISLSSCSHIISLMITNMLIHVCCCIGNTMCLSVSIHDMIIELLSNIN